MSSAATGSWDAEYATGRRYTEAEPPVAFTADILDVAKDRDITRGLYVGSGNGRNFGPLSDAGLDLVGLDISQVAAQQLADRFPRYADRLVVGDLSALPEGQTYPLVLALQVIQHGTRGECHLLLEQTLARVEPGGLFAVRANGTGTDVRHRHDVVERDVDGSFAVRYTEGPKTGLTVHFWSALELDTAIGAAGFSPVLRLRPASTWRDPATLGQWLQWEGIFAKD